MKSVAFNLVLAHSLGVCCAFAASLAPVHMMGCFIRVHDTVGTDSLYQAEVRRCADLIGRVHKCPGRAVLFLDEPMHSTPPTEGAATAMSVCDFLAALPNVTVLATTHYHVLTQLDHRAYFTNISMEAIPKPDGAYTFPYKVRPGASFQCIALELLEVEDLPQEIVGGAIEIKNKICAGEVECLVPTPA
jgi:DNA mismatch repair protein MutS